MKYELRRSKRARRMRVAVRPGGAVAVTAPIRMPVFLIERFMARHAQWIQKAVARQAKHKASVLPRPSTKEFKKYKAQALTLVRERIKILNAVYRFTFQKIAIRNQRTLWGSCSRSGTLSFNYRIIFLPAELRDYLIAHELCHIKEMNHSVRFWREMERTIPHAKKVRRQFKLLGYTLS